MRKNLFLCLALYISISQASSLDEAYFNLANCWASKGNSHQAIANFKETLQHNPQHTQALLLLGCELYKTGATAEAITYFEKRLQLMPTCGQTENYLGMAHAVLGNFKEAAQYYQKSMEHLQPSAKTCFLYGMALQNNGDTTQAINAYQHGLTLEPHNYDIITRIAQLLKESKQYEQALHYINQLAQQFPNSIEYQLEKAGLLVHTKKIADAVVCYEQILTLSPNNATILSILGSLHTQLGAYDKALSLHTRSMQLQDTADAHLNVARLHGMQGNLSLFFKHLHLANIVGKNNHKLLPTLEHARGKTILIQGEWFHEDMLQFIRFAPLLKELDAFVIVQAPQALQPLLSQCPYIDKVIAIEKKESSYFDYHIPVLSLPYICSVSAQNLCTHMPYLYINKTRTTQWQSKLAPASPKVGLYIKQLPSIISQEDLLTHVAALCNDIYMLHPTTPTDMFTKKLSHQTIVHMVGNGFHESAQSLVELAALMSNLNYIITTDCTAAHLAGALGLKTIVLLDEALPWRWTLDDNRTPWYPTMRVIPVKKQEDIKQLLRAFKELQ